MIHRSNVGESIHTDKADSAELRGSQQLPALGLVELLWLRAVFTAFSFAVITNLPEGSGAESAMLLS